MANLNWSVPPTRPGVFDPRGARATADLPPDKKDGGSLRNKQIGGQRISVETMKFVILYCKQIRYSRSI